MTRFGFLYIAIFSLLITAGNPAAVLAEESNNAAPMAAMSTDALASASGGSEAQITSIVSGNTIGSMGNTGGISNININNNSGLTTVIQNTGSQVSIATSTVVNMNFH